MTGKGWIIVHRDIMDMPEWLSEPFTRGQAWIDLLLLANHKAGFIRRRGILVAVERGQVGWSEEALADRWKWSRGKVRRFFKELLQLSRIERRISEKTVQKKTSVSALYCITNYDKYQLRGTEDGTENGRKTVQEQVIKEKKSYTSSFLTFWNAYPRKVGKDSAWKAWQKRNGDMPDIDALLSALEKQKKSEQWRNKNFIPHPSTWINRGGWNDEIDEASGGDGWG